MVLGDLLKTKGVRGLAALVLVVGFAAPASAQLKVDINKGNPQPMPIALPTANTARPSTVLMPSRLAAAPPAKAPFGMACAANVTPRMTTK